MKKTEKIREVLASLDKEPKPPRILTQRQAYKQFPDDEYETYDPCYLIVGTRYEVLCSLSDVKLTCDFTLGFRKFHSPAINVPQASPQNIQDRLEFADDNLEVLRKNGAVSIDVNLEDDYRVVVWK